MADLNKLAKSIVDQFTVDETNQTPKSSPQKSKTKRPLTDSESAQLARKPAKRR